MGGTSSSNSTKIDVSAAVTLLSQNIMNCASNTMASQELVVSGNFNVVDGRQMQTLHLSATCSQNAQNIADLQQQISTALKAAAEAQSTALLGALNSTSSDVSTMITNDVKQNITQQTVANIVNSTNLQQKILISGDRNIVNFSQEQTAQLVFTSCQDVINNLKSVQTMNNALDTSSSATTKNPLAEVVDSLGNMFKINGWFIVIIAGIAIIFLGPKLFGSDEQQQQMGYGYQQPYGYQQSPYGYYR